ncbi:MAG: hypothetical protein ABJA57_06785, partial [Ginsengibacter sp.]
MKRLSLFITIQLFGLQAFSQPAWKLVKEKNGMKIFMASVENSKFKSIRVQAVFEGTIQKLMSVVGNISKHPEWVYKAKTAYILKRVNDNDFFYYIESS